MTEHSPVHADPERRRGRPRKYGITTEPDAPPPRSDAPLPVFLTPEQAAEVLGVSAQTVRARCEDGKLLAIDLGDGQCRLWRIYRDRLLPDGDASDWKARALRAESKLAQVAAVMGDDSSD